MPLSCCSVCCRSTGMNESRMGKCKSYKKTVFIKFTSQQERKVQAEIRWNPNNDSSGSAFYSAYWIHCILSIPLSFLGLYFRCACTISLLNKQNMSSFLSALKLDSQVFYWGHGSVRRSVETRWNPTPEPEPDHAWRVTGRKLTRAVF